MRSALTALTCTIALAFPVAAPAQPAIVGGSVSAPGAWPWAAAVEWMAPDGSGVPACTGSLIGERWVLTAAHCVLDPFTGVTIHQLQYRIIIGQDNIAQPALQNAYTADEGDVIANAPQAGTLLTGAPDGDLALIRLDRPAPQQAIRIPGTAQDAAAASTPGTTAEVIGWGVTDENAPDVSYDLRQVDVPIVSDADCHAAYPTLDFYGYVTGFDPTTMICAGLAQGGKDSCAGDSGGPLMAPDGSGGWLQIGITSWGEGCARSGKPGVYGRLSGLYGFIVASLAKDAEAPAGAPQATTGPPARIAKRAVLTAGTVTPNGLATSYVIELGPNRRYGSRTQGYAGAGSATVAVSATFTGLRRKKTYHYRVTAINVAGVVRGADQTFTTR